MHIAQLDKIAPLKIYTPTLAWRHKQYFFSLFFSPECIEHCQHWLQCRALAPTFTVHMKLHTRQQQWCRYQHKDNPHIPLAGVPLLWGGGTSWPGFTCTLVDIYLFVSVFGLVCILNFAISLKGGGGSRKAFCPGRGTEVCLTKSQLVGVFSSDFFSPRDESDGSRGEPKGKSKGKALPLVLGLVPLVEFSRARRRARKAARGRLSLIHI